MLVLALAVASERAAAQEPTGSWDPAEGQVTREQLSALLERMERAAESPAYSSVLREEARVHAARIRERLDQGDFRPGDRVYIRVEQHAELTDTFAVAADRALTLQGMGAVPLTGVLRSELDQRVLESVATIIRNPRVQTRSLVRLSLTGAVGRPGFHVVDSQALLSDVLMAAGGPSPNAKLDGIRVERNGEMLLASDVVREALNEGRTIDQLGLRDGDRVEIPSRRSDLLDSLRDVFYVIPTALGLLGILL